MFSYKKISAKELFEEIRSKRARPEKQQAQDYDLLSDQFEEIEKTESKTKRRRE